MSTIQSKEKRDIKEARPENITLAVKDMKLIADLADYPIFASQLGAATYSQDRSILESHLSGNMIEHCKAS